MSAIVYRPPCSVRKRAKRSERSARGAVINNATEGQPLSVYGRGTRQRGGGCALVGVGFPDGRWAVLNYLLRCALSLENKEMW